MAPNAALSETENNTGEIPYMKAQLNVLFDIWVTGSLLFIHLFQLAYSNNIADMTYKWIPQACVAYIPKWLSQELFYKDAATTFFPNPSRKWMTYFFYQFAGHWFDDLPCRKINNVKLKWVQQESRLWEMLLT